MKILSFDTTSQFLSVCLSEDGKILHENKITEKAKHSEKLITEIEKILKKSAIWYQNLDLISCSNGPGSFAGSRIALSVARIIKLANKTPLILVNSLEIFANKYKQNHSHIIVTNDAHMNEFFCAEYKIDNEKITEITSPFILGEENFSFFKDKKNFFLCGDKKEEIAEKIAHKNFEISNQKDEISASLIAKLAYHKYLKNISRNSENLNPLYLRNPKIEKRKK